MPAMAANAKSILLGDLSQFFVRRTGVELKIFRELYATSGAVGFQSFVRAGGTLAVSGTVKYYQNSAA
jgi:HK97 family phage major capsid protein